MIAQFTPGEHVFVLDDHYKHIRAFKRCVWQVVEEDTNRTPVLDPEPAYKLCAVSRREVVRYAYESCLARVVDILAADGQKVEGQVGSGNGHSPAVGTDPIQEGS